MVNKLLAQMAASVTEERGIIWVHDFQLMLVPNYLRKQSALEVRIGYFQHIPFPSSEMFRMFPYRKRLLKSIICSNVIGFNGHDYLCHFLDSCTTVLGLIVSSQRVDGLAAGGCFAKVGVYPVTVDCAYLKGLLQDPEVQRYAQQLRESFGNKKIIVGVDKVDYVKGVTHKLLAYEYFLKTVPEMRENVILVEILGDMQELLHSPERQKLLSQINILITQVNGIYGSFTGLPIHHLTQKMSIKELMALLSIADVYYMSTLRDGLNLTALEFVCLQQNNPGVVLLSEFSGAAQSIGAGSIMINPWNIKSSAAAIKRSLEMSLDERKQRHGLMLKYLEGHSPYQWASTFLRDLASVQEESGVNTIPKLLPTSDAIASYKLKKKRLLVFTVFGVLAEPVKKTLNAMQYHNLITVSYKVKEMLRTLGNDPANTVVVLAPLEPKYMDRLFYGLPIWLGAENGFFYKHGTETTWLKLHETPDLTWRDEVLKTFQYYKSHTPGSFITGDNPESTYLSWNYGSSACSFEFQKQQAKSLLVHLFSDALSNTTAEIVVGNRSIDVRPYRTSPKDLVARIVSNAGGLHAFDYVLVLASLVKKDEDLYRYLAGSKLHTDLPSESSSRNNSLSAEEADVGAISTDAPDLWQCTIEKAITFAQFYVPQPKEFLAKLLAGDS